MLDLRAASSLQALRGRRSPMNRHRRRCMHADALDQTLPNTGSRLSGASRSLRAETSVFCNLCLLPHHLYLLDGFVMVLVVLAIHVRTLFSRFERAST
eukprot:6188841-Pleurochrysis_carterae.AAC.4